MNDNLGIYKSENLEVICNLFGVFYVDEPERDAFIKQCIEKYRDELSDGEADFLVNLVGDVLKLCISDFKNMKDTEFHERKTLIFIQRLCRYANDIWSFFHDVKDAESRYELYFNYYLREIDLSRKLYITLLKNELESLNSIGRDELSSLSMATKRIVVLVNYKEKAIKDMLQKLQDIQLQEDIEDLEKILFGYSNDGDSHNEAEDFNFAGAEGLRDSLNDDNRIDFDRETIDLYEREMKFWDGLNPEPSMSFSMNGRNIPENEIKILAAYINDRYKGTIPGEIWSKAFDDEKYNSKMEIPGEYEYVKSVAEEMEVCFRDIAKIFSNVCATVSVHYMPDKDFFDDHGGFITVTLDRTHVVTEDTPII